MRKKVVFLLRYWAIHGGGETVTIALANEMVKRGHDVTVIYLWDNNRDVMPFIDKRIKTVRFASKNGEDLKIENVILSSLLKRYIEDNDIDFVINQWWLAEVAYHGVVDTKAVLIKCHHISVQGTWKIKVQDFESLIKFILGPIHIKISKKLQIKAIEKFYRQSDYVAFLAPSYVEEFKSLTRLDIDGSRVLSIFNPLVYNSAMTIEDYPKKKNIALFVGRIEDSQKRVKLLLKAWSLIERTGKCTDWILKIVGTGTDLDDVKKEAKKLNLKFATFEGFQQPDEYYKEAKVFMMTSRTEGLPMTLIEAKQNRLCPIVMDTFPSLHDIITNGKDGIVVKDDIKQFVNAFLSLAKDPNSLERLGCAIEGTDKFSVDSIVNEWENLFGTAKKYIK